MQPLLTCLTDVLFLIFFCLAAFVQYNDPDPLFWEIVYLVPASLSLVGLCKPQLKGLPFWKKLLKVPEVFYSCLAVNLLWTLVTTYPKAATDEKRTISLQNIFHTLELEEGRKLKFVTPLFIVIMPFVLWGCCYISGIHEILSYCRHIAKTCTADKEILQV